MRLHTLGTKRGAKVCAWLSHTAAELLRRRPLIIPMTNRHSHMELITEVLCKLSEQLDCLRNKSILQLINKGPISAHSNQRTSSAGVLIFNTLP